MAAITEDYVSFEIAKLLKEKGFDESTSMVYMPYGDLCKLDRYDSIRNSNYNDITKNYFEYTAPTIQMAMKWLREVHNIAIVITPSMFWGKYNASIYKKGNDYPYGFDGDSLVSSYKKAAEVAIKHCLENLI